MLRLVALLDTFMFKLPVLPSFQHKITILCTHLNEIFFPLSQAWQMKSATKKVLFGGLVAQCSVSVKFYITAILWVSNFGLYILTDHFSQHMRNILLQISWILKNNLLRKINDKSFKWNKDFILLAQRWPWEMSKSF